MRRVSVENVISTTDARLDIERRFLAALFLYPRAVDIEVHHFLSPHHGELYRVIREAYETFPWPHAIVGTYDDIALAICLELVKQRAAEISKAMGRPEYNDHQVKRFAENYFLTSLFTQSVTARGLDDLIAQVRECPRCGR